MKATVPPGAVNGLPLPLTLTAIDRKVAVFTVKVAEPTTLPRLAGAVAVIVVEPGETDVVSPLLAPELLTVATLGLVDAQFDGTVRS